jgi:Putative zinc- or iron-chelating domain
MTQREIMMLEGSVPHSAACAAAAHNGISGQALDELREEIVGGLLYTHSRANSNTSRVLESAAFLYALVELLNERGIISIAELDERKITVAQRLEQRFRDKGMGVHLQRPEQDKYTVQGAVQIDCASRLHLCQAACCRLWFPLSQQDVEEGVVRWDLHSPYIIAQDAEGYCRHLDRGTCRCGVYEQRPLPCRVFDCRNDKRIWLDFDNMVINPNLEDMFQGGAPHPSESAVAAESA